ncbi:MAG: hypothetical protein COU81_03130 [Candidatus Portnoybacteria bacterium CG10_big_fil_rev_8_21_14_0_10_36_7]|uniref:Uncharacterized protein n=1 Tax=Candidatus Portnoybacteria bacterium CG10_big_fil_rev_8_21_14_0_10_36_7 TaxID=1974812 RepID=A0A2M8KDJ3_9BACT|nr:MAG: hypothetical protein COU81_03130 [Candidatus Portnoybacteria bacterium CG10_big_fil_rev_8_21_14_0_10_36_7]
MKKIIPLISVIVMFLIAFTWLTSFLVAAGVIIITLFGIWGYAKYKTKVKASMLGTVNKVSSVKPGEFIVKYRADLVGSAMFFLLWALFPSEIARMPFRWIIACAIALAIILISGPDAKKSAAGFRFIAWLTIFGILGYHTAYAKFGEQIANSSVSQAIVRSLEQPKTFVVKPSKQINTGIMFDAGDIVTYKQTTNKKYFINKGSENVPITIPTIIGECIAPGEVILVGGDEPVEVTVTIARK